MFQVCVEIISNSSTWVEILSYLPISELLSFPRDNQELRDATKIDLQRRLYSGLSDRDLDSVTDKLFENYTRASWIMEAIETTSSDSPGYNQTVHKIFVKSAEVGHLDIFARSLNTFSISNDTLTSALAESSDQGHLEIVRLLLQDGRADPSAFVSEALRYASLYGHSEVVRLLLQDGRADPSAYESEALRYASDRGHLGFYISGQQWIRL